VTAEQPTPADAARGPGHEDARASPAIESLPRTRPIHTRLTPAKGWAALDLPELWDYRELLYFLTWRDVKVRYKQTLLGAAWAVLQPFFTMVVFSVFFGRLAGVPSEGLPYPLFAFTGLVPWTYFAGAVTQASNSLVNHEGMLRKLFFPRMLLPLSAVAGGLIDLGIAFVVLIGISLYYGVVPTAAAWTIPLFVLLAATTALAVGLWLSALNVYYRDVRHTVPFLIQFWLFATPVIYPASLIPERWRPLYGLNPMAGVVEGFRWALLGTGQGPGPLMAVSLCSVAVLLVSGLYVFRRLESAFADEV
jgi:lipopolysaccharide transport system permease protein